jgi:hypothetical protein
MREVTKYFYRSNPSALAKKGGKFRVAERKKEVEVEVVFFEMKMKK